MNKKLKNIINSKTFIVILSLVLVCAVFLVGTYAWFTWNSPNNTKFVMTIGNDIADVTFESGNDINTGLLPVYNYSEGVSTTFSINNRGTTDTGIIIYRVKFNITSIDDKLINEGVKYVLVKDGALIAQGDLSNAYNGVSLTLTEGDLGPGTSSFILYFYLDAGIETDLSAIGKALSGNIMVEADDFETTVTPLDDFYWFSYDDIRLGIFDLEGSIDVPIPSIEKNEILLTKYDGKSKSVVIPDNYVVEGESYDVVVLSYADYRYEDEILDDFGDPVPVTMSGSTGIFYNNDSIVSVSFSENVKFISLSYGYGNNQTDNSAIYLFYNCKNLVNVSLMPHSVTSMLSTFMYCDSLVNAPAIPNSVTNMTDTFYGCTSLVNVPEIPSSVTSMSSTFMYCDSLVNAPEIPDSVINMYETFAGCGNLVTAPEIPSSVTNMQRTFQYCRSLKGTVRVNSSETIFNEYTFDGTKENIIVEVPVGSTTYTNISELAANNGLPSNVTLKTF